MKTTNRWVFVLGVLGLILACTQKKETSSELATVKEKMEANKVIVLDVREEQEISQGMVKGAKWVPTSKIAAQHEDWQQFLNQLDKNKEIYVYCRSGGRASKVVEILKSNGYKAKNMGGFSSWVEEKLPWQKMCPSPIDLKECS